MEKITLLTKHRKAAALCSALSGCGFKLCSETGFDTDQLSTFSGARSGATSLRGTALQKAKLGAELGNTRYGLGSEGSFGLDPFIELTPWNTEVLAWWDRVEQYAVYAFVQGPETNFNRKFVDSVEEAERFVTQCKFPAHGVIIGKPGEVDYYQDLANTEQMKDMLVRLLPQSAVWLETDMRAHRNPTRMRMIERCARRLAMNLRSACPVCSKAGFVAVAQIPGAVCESCGAKTAAARAELFNCLSCGHEEERKLSSLAPASRCDHCTPVKRRPRISAPRRRDSPRVLPLR